MNPSVVEGCLISDYLLMTKSDAQAIIPSTEGLCMLGSIISLQKCAYCGSLFKNQDSYGLCCENHHHVRPTRYVVQAKFAGLPLIYSTPQGNVLDSYERASRLLSAIRTAWDDSKVKFNPDDWKPKKVVEQRFENKAKEYLDEYKIRHERGKLSKGYYRHIETFINDFLIPTFTGHDTRKITAEQINSFYYGLLEKSYSDNYVKHIMACLKGIFLKYRAEVPDFPAGWQNVTVKRPKQRLQIERQIAIAPHIPERHGYRLAIDILLTTGMRPCELRALQVNDIADNGVMVWKSLTDTLKLKRKSGGEVFYPLPNYLFDDLRAHVKDKTADDFIFTINGKPYGYGRLRKVWIKACSDAKVKHIELYQACRHSWASLEMKRAKEEALERISKQLGHSREMSRKHYIIEPSHKTTTKPEPPSNDK